MTKTFRQFLEDKQDLVFQDLLKGPCVNFFRQSQKNGLLVRGMKGYGQLEGKMTLGEGFEGISFDVFRKAVRKERKATDTGKYLSKVIDDWFEDRHGIRARSEAMFCFGEAGRENAYMYGPLCVVLPIGKFTYVWSPKVGDLFEDVVLNKMQREGGNIMKPYIELPSGKLNVDAIWEVMDGLGYTINGFSKAVGDAVEIMIDCDEYYVIPLSVNEEDRIKQLGILKKAFVHA